MYKVYLKSGKEESLKRFHPWVFSGAIAHFDGEPEEGEVVEIYTSKKEFIAKGHFQIGSIAVRVLSFHQDEAIDFDFWKRKLSIAYEMRRSIGIAENPTNNTYRLVHGEGDNLPGLIIDIYARTAVMQAHSAGMHLDRMEIANALSEVMGDKIENIYYKSETTLPFKADLYPENGFLKGGSTDNVAMEYGLKFHIDWLKGQKTGFFVDQRENRSLLERYANGRSILNMFCYTGGFSVYGMRGNAKLVHSVDSSAKAIDLTNKNIELNFPGDARHAAFCRRCLQISGPHGRPIRLDCSGHACICQTPRCFAQCPARLPQTECKSFREDQTRRYSIYFFLLASSQQRKLPHGSLHSSCNVRSQRSHPASTDATRRPSGKYISSRRGISERISVVCRINSACTLVLIKGESILYILKDVKPKKKTTKTLCCIT